jgi:hypothetical protein
MKRSALLVAVSAATACGIAFAQYQSTPSSPGTTPSTATKPDRAKPAMEADASPDFSMSKLDKNKDGMVDKQEAKSSGKLHAIFDKYDANKDGKIDATELTAAAQSAKGN